MKVQTQCNQACSKAKRMLGLIKRTIKFKTTEIMLCLYKSLVRPHVEYCSSVWSPYIKKDKFQVEQIQQRFTRIFSELIDKPYDVRLDILGLWSLEGCRSRADLIEVLKIVKAFCNVNHNLFFDIDSTSRIRGHSYKIIKYLELGDTHTRLSNTDSPL